MIKNRFSKFVLVSAKYWLYFCIHLVKFIMKRTIFFTFFFFLWVLPSRGQYIKSIQLNPLSEKHFSVIIPLGSGIQLSFDDLEADNKEYQYKIEHMTWDWKKSKLLPNQYIEGFNQGSIINNTNSFNTLQNYTHYYVRFPNKQTRIKLSGNYLLSVLDEYEDIIFTRKFTLYENNAIVGVNVMESRNTKTVNQQQTVQFIINHPNININLPSKEIKVIILQNEVWQTAIKNIQPTFFKPQQLVYLHFLKTNFWGGNEYLNFDNKILRNKSLNIVKITKNDVYHHYLYPYQYKNFKAYQYNPDINGQFLIRTLEGTIAETEADYVEMHFSLEVNTPFNEDIYVYGAFNNFELNDENKLIYNYKTNTYKTSILLKQGFYNYTFVSKNSKNQINIGKIRGNFSSTENKYTVLVYYRPFGGLYDRVIGVGTTFFDGER